MAETVREMVVRMTMDAGNFKKAASDINGQIRNLNRELRGMGDGVDGSKLQEKLSLQQSAVKNLENAVAAARLTLNKSLGTDTELAAAKDLANLESRLERAKQEALNTELQLRQLDGVRLQNLGQSITNIGEGLVRFGRKFSLYIGGPLAMLGGKAYKSALSYENVMTDLGIATETTGEELEAINETVLELSENIPFTYQELGGLMATLARAGVPADDLERVTRIVAGLGKTTDVSSEESAAAMIKFMNVMGMPLSQIENFASALIGLGNEGVSTGTEIFEMGQKIAPIAKLAGMTGVEVLAMASAFSSMGISAEAGGTSAGKMITMLQMAAETGEGLEDLSRMMGLTEQQFKTMWNEDKSDTIINFFDALSKGGADGNQTVLALLQDLGVSEVRLRNLMASAASNPDMFREMVGIGQKAWDENKAFAEGTEKAYSTMESKQDIALNKMENTLADYGENVAEIVQPVIQAVGDLADKFGELDEETQTRWVEVGMALIALGPAASFLGKVAKGVGGIVGWIGKVKAGEAGALVKVLKALASPELLAVLAGVGVGAGLFGLLMDLETPTERIVNNLKNIDIKFNENSYNATKQALEELQAQSDALSGYEGRKNKALSEAIKSGLVRTSADFGTAVGYEAAFTRDQVLTIVGSYEEQLDELAVAIGETTDEHERQRLADRRNALIEQRDNEVRLAKENYMAQVSALISGIMQAQPEAAAALQRASKDYDLFALISEWYKGINTGTDAEQAGRLRQITQAVKDLGYEDFIYGLTSDNVEPAMLDLQNFLADRLAKDFETVSKGELGFGLLQNILENAMTAENFDPTLATGLLDGLVELLDFRNAADRMTTDFEWALTPGLADGIMGASSESVRKMTQLGDDLSKEAERAGAKAAAAFVKGFGTPVLNAPVLQTTPSTGSIKAISGGLNDLQRQRRAGYGQV
jgi:TP901 family phage tail tape measure protein